MYHLNANFYRFQVMLVLPNPYSLVSIVTQKLKSTSKFKNRRKNSITVFLTNFWINHELNLKDKMNRLQNLLHDSLISTQHVEKSAILNKEDYSVKATSIGFQVSILNIDGFMFKNSTIMYNYYLITAQR